jgi:ParB family chromosome partitioning protein
MAAKINGYDLYAYVLPEGKEQTCIDFFSKNYGEFNYEMIERKTYMQSFAQKARLRQSSKDPNKQAGHSRSTLYEKCVLPYITKDMRVLDFGAGHKDYATKLARMGYKIDAIEFYHRREGSNLIDEKEIRKDFATICEHLKAFGRYDVVICDSVLNSVDTEEAEWSVLQSLSALCKQGGIVFWSGIPFKFIMDKNNFNTADNMKCNTYFPDAKKFTANFRNGDWFFQHYHDINDVKRLCSEIYGDLSELKDLGITVTKRKSDIMGASFQCKCVNKQPRTKKQLIEAIRFEFSLPLPGGKRWDFADTIIPILEPLL